MRAIQSICLMFMMMLVSYAASAAESVSTTLTGEGWTIETQGRTQAAGRIRARRACDPVRNHYQEGIQNQTMNLHTNRQ